MIAFDFDYYKPGSIDEAVQAYMEADLQGKEPKYYGGGTEIISMARMNNIHTGAIIDIKGMPECNIFEFQNDRLIIGAAVTLTRIAEANLFPLLGMTCKRIADHTIQGKINIGGNVCGTIIYREAVLPLLLSDSWVILAGINGQRTVPLSQVFNERMQLEKGEFVVQFIINKSFTGLPYAHVKRTKQDKIEYPLITATALKKDNLVRIALSGLCGFPFRSTVIEDELNDSDIPLNIRINNAVGKLPAPILNDIQGSAEYREFVLKNIMASVLERLGE